MVNNAPNGSAVYGSLDTSRRLFPLIILSALISTRCIPHTRSAMCKQPFLLPAPLEPPRRSPAYIMKEHSSLLSLSSRVSATRFHRNGPSTDPCRYPRVGLLLIDTPCGSSIVILFCRKPLASLPRDLCLTKCSEHPGHQRWSKEPFMFTKLGGHTSGGWPCVRRCPTLLPPWT